jgi:hypothetical protein
MRRLKTTKRRRASKYKPIRPIRNDQDGLEDNQSWMVGTIDDPNDNLPTLPTGVTK